MRLLVALALIANVVSAPASAKPANLSREAKALLLRAYTACIATKRPALVGQYLFDREREQHRERYEVFADRDCVKQAGYTDFRTLRAAEPAISGAWSEQALSRRDTAGLEPRFAALPPVGHARLMSVEEYRPEGRFTRAQFAEHVAHSNGQRQLGFVAECVVRAAPSHARAVFATAPETPGEAAALGALRADLGKCVNGISMRFRPDQLRTALAINYLRLAAAADPALKDRLF